MAEWTVTIRTEFKGDMQPVIQILDDFAVQAARQFVEYCKTLIEQRGRIHVGLTGGGTAQALYEALVRPEILDGLDVRAIDFYMGDERPVPPSDPQSNWGMAATTFLDPAGVPQENRHRMRAEAADLDQAAHEYERLLRDRLPQVNQTPAFDLLLLGMGADGHTASLFPGTTALEEASRLVVPNYVPKLSMNRLTFTYPLINASQAVWILASGANKAEATRRVLDGRDPTLPVTGVAPHHGMLVWLVDRSASDQLSTRGSASG